MNRSEQAQRFVLRINDGAVSDEAAVVELPPRAIVTVLSEGQAEPLS